MPALIDLFNRALGWCRAQAMVTLEEDTVSGRACRRFYATSRDATLRAYPWNSAASRAVLAALVDAPEFEFDHQYRLPDDCLAVRQLWDDPQADYVVEGRSLLTNLSAPLRLKYTARIEPDGMDPLLFNAVAARLAYDIAPGLTESSTVTDKSLERFAAAVREARAVDAAEGVPAEVPGAYGWMDARL
ncbi:hypothetical protein AZL_025420 [Azospirillum sp. B510]|uniref:hypothetical protein n=1 Tax=Azospirillum sp. (strain B510) TaxID=137722 RepID=UPI0001C4CBEC|nr:hypothetical protein [Azospirillum sp. B510]BAI73180.1 hypothetical protein AZL_025420 [Azospirillum sp. B510]